ncbi:protein FAM78B-like [Gigantopelta aegis]|uniref:protein FAM78B-like n=1 Tax=Gigantopelta aegis TaxID=1735272 RepID=UPI001B88BEE8|nr:protein FAM78B-like [Gigantopelta aegis]
MHLPHLKNKTIRLLEPFATVWWMLMDVTEDMGLASSSTRKIPTLPQISISPSKQVLQKIRAAYIDGRIDNEPTQIDESSPAVLKYRTPNFRATATIEMSPSDETETWKVGWIQACTDMLFHNQYKDEGYTSWEFPELISGKQSMISDCDGRHYPWYGSRNETVIFETPCSSYQRATVTMNDNFHPHVTWRNPANRNQVEPNLSHIVRDQSFYVWLVVWNMTTMKSYILQTIRWTMKLEIEVNPKAELGKRARLISDPKPIQPVLLEKNVPIPHCALVPPNANSAQMLVWHPNKGKCVCIIPPVWNAEERETRIESKL